MPTTHEEARKIVDICVQEGMETPTIARLFRRLKVEVGDYSDNDSVKKTMEMLASGASMLDDYPSKTIDARPFSEQERTKSSWLLAWGALVISHFAIWIAFWIACVMAALYQPWYITLITISFCIYLVAVDVTCPVTVWENHIRKQLGWQAIPHFTNHYVVRPIAKLFK